jgi:hypothetical protein
MGEVQARAAHQGRSAITSTLRLQGRPDHSGFTCRCRPHDQEEIAARVMAAHHGLQRPRKMVPHLRDYDGFPKDWTKVSPVKTDDKEQHNDNRETD